MLTPVLSIAASDVLKADNPELRAELMRAFDDAYAGRVTSYSAEDLAEFVDDDEVNGLEAKEQEAAPTRVSSARKAPKKPNEGRQMNDVALAERDRSSDWWSFSVPGIDGAFGDSPSLAEAPPPRRWVCRQVDLTHDYELATQHWLGRCQATGVDRLNLSTSSSTENGISS
jgi:hypothetical protein